MSLVVYRSFDHCCVGECWRVRCIECRRDLIRHQDTEDAARTAVRAHTCAKAKR